MSSNADHLRHTLRGLVDEKKQAREQFIAGLDHSSLEKLALSALAQKRADTDREAAERAREQEQLRVRWTRAHLERVSPIMTRLFAERLEIPGDSPLLVELRWRFDPTDLAGLRFEEQDGKVRATTTNPDAKLPQLHADIGALTVRADARSIDGEITAATFTALVGPNETRGIGNLEALGEAIEKAQNKLAG